MRKVLIYTPALILVLFYGYLIIVGAGKISPIVLVWLILFLAAGILLNKGMLWGSLLGIIPAINLIFMSTIETGQVVNIELPVGIIILLFYVVGGYIFYKKRD